MSYRSFLLGSVAVLALSTAAPAAETTPEGAEAIVKSMTGLLPDTVKNTGFIAAVPEGDHYRLSIDLGKLVALFKPDKGKFNLSSLYELQIYPAGADGLMKVKRDSLPLSVNADWDVGTEKGNLSYLIKDFVFEGDFDPAISYFRSAVGHASGGSMTSSDGKADVKASFGPSDYTMAGQKNAAGAVDFSTSGTISGLSETVAGPGAPPVTLTMGNIGADAKVTGLKLAELSELITYVIAHADEKPLSPETKRGVADRIGKAMPMLDALTEEVKIDDLSVLANGITAKFGSIGYRLGFGGFKDDSELHFGLSVADPSINGVPEVVAFGDLIPKTMTMTVSVNHLNFATMAQKFIAQAESELTDAQMDEIGKSILKDGRVHIEVPEFEATSPLYNLSLKGHISTDAKSDSAKANAEFDVTARDLDKTIAGIQELAQKVPDLNTASFGLMMAKGMAKNDAEGNAHWKVEVAEDGQVKINGQVMPH